MFPTLLLFMYTSHIMKIHQNVWNTQFFSFPLSLSLALSLLSLFLSPFPADTEQSQFPL
jgi:hypothetical protein